MTTPETTPTPLGPPARARSLQVRVLEAGDHPAVLELIDADRVPGQPGATAARLREVLAGRSAVDAGWWAELSRLRHDVAVHDGRVIGVIASGWRARDRTTVILWCHAREDPTVLQALIEHALARRPGARAEAFGFATGLGLGLEALPVVHRAGTDRALRAAGFTGTDTWAYLRADLTARPATYGAESTGPTIAVTETGEFGEAGGWQLEITRPGHGVVAEAHLARPVQGIGVLFWIEVTAAHRGHGLGRALLSAALDHARRDGADQVILYVDDDDPGGARDRTAALRLYRSAGFELVDRLHSYTRR